MLYVRPVRDVYDLDESDVVASSPKVRLLLPLLLLRLDLGDVLEPEAVADVRSLTMHSQVWAGRLQEPGGATLLRACRENNWLRYRATRTQAYQMILGTWTSLTSGRVVAAARLSVSVYISPRSERHARGLAVRDGARGGGAVAVGARVVGRVRVVRRVRPAGRARGVVPAVLRRPGQQPGAMARAAVAINGRLHTCPHATSESRPSSLDSSNVLSGALASWMR